MANFSDYLSPICGFIAGAGALSIACYDFWHQRNKRACCELILAVFCVAQAVKDYRQVSADAEKDDLLAHELTSLHPKPFEERLRIFLTPEILSQLRDGVTVFKVRIHDFQWGEFQKLLSEKESSKYIKTLAPEPYVVQGEVLRRMGEWRLVVIELDKSLIADAVKSPSTSP